MAKAHGTAPVKDQEGETTKQSKQESDKNQVALSIADPYDAMLCLKTMLKQRIEALQRMSTRLDMCQIALKKYVRFPTESEAEKETDEIKHFEFFDRKSPGRFTSCANHIEYILTERADIHEMKCLVSLAAACSRLAMLRSKNMSTRQVLLFDMYEQIVTQKSYEAIGYWKAKLEEMARNKKSTKTLKERHKKNEEVIGKALTEFRIKSLLDFRGNKKTLKEPFILRAKSETHAKNGDPLEEKTIMDIARSILKKKDTALDTRAPA